VFIIWNPTNSSWSGFRTNYFAGEFCEVELVSGSVVTTKAGLYDTYTGTAVEVHKLTACTPRILNYGTIKGKNSLNVIQVLNGTPYIWSGDIQHENNAAVLALRCYKPIIEGNRIKNIGDGGDDYGISIGNSQHSRITGGSSYSRRHAVTHGGGVGAGSVPCRDCITTDMTLTNDIDSGVHNADFHGNTEHSWFVNCDIHGGATWQGANNGYKRCRITNWSIGEIISAAEILGGHHSLLDCDLFTNNDPQVAFGSAMVDVGGNGNDVTANTVRDTRFIIRGGSIRAINQGSSVSFMKMINRGTDKKVDISITNFEFDVNDLGQLLLTQLVSGTADSNGIEIDSIRGGLPAAIILHNASGSSYLDVPHRLPTLSGTEQLTTSTSSPVVSGTPVVFPYTFPRIPHTVVGRNNRGVFGNRVGVPFADPLSVTGLTPQMSSDDGTNFTAAVTFDLQWHVNIKEF
jgi:hypothetical protein